MTLVPDRAVTLVVRPVDDVCNLACEYCNARPYGGGHDRMTDAVLETLIAQAASASTHHVRFCWHGGEPLLAGAPFYRNAIAHQKEWFGEEGVGRRYDNVLQSNGLLLRGELLKVLLDADFRVGLSIDGPDAETNEYRFGARDGQRLVERTIAAAKRLQDHGQPLLIITVVHDKNVTQPRRLYNFYRDLGVDTVSFNPRFLSGQPHPRNVRPSDYREFLEELIRIRSAERRKGARVFSFGVVDEVLASGRGGRPSLCFLNGTCHKFLSVNRKGEIFASCTDALRVRVGSVDHPGLTHAIKRLTAAPILDVQRQLGSSRSGSNHTGCPKYSHGTGDVYMPELRQLANTARA